MIKNLWKHITLTCGNGHTEEVVIKYTGENPVACLWDEAKIKK